MPAIRFRPSFRIPPITVEDYRARARRKLPKMVWAYLDGGSEDMTTIAGNRRAFARWGFLPRVLTGNEATDLTVELGGETLQLPVFLCPTAMTGLMNWRGESAAAQAAEKAGTRAVISTAASYSPEEIAEVTSGAQFFQLYAGSDGVNGTRAITKRFIDRAQAAGFTSVFVTVDVPARSNRESERRTGMGMPPILNPQGLFNAAFKFRWWFDFLAHNRLAARMLVDGKGAQAGVESVEVQYSLQRPDLDWDDFAWIRANWKGQVFIKGVLHPDDAEKAVDLGADGVLVSNHGGRQLDFSQASLDALPAIVERVGHRVPVLLDGGVRRGTDVVKALCLGATAVGIGRPYIYGLSADGQRGVEHVLEIFREEIATTLTLLGVSSVRDLGPEYLVRLEP